MSTLVEYYTEGEPRGLVSLGLEIITYCLSMLTKRLKSIAGLGLGDHSHAQVTSPT